MASSEDISNRVLQSSLSDNGEYPDLCASAAENDAVFQSFKTHPSYRPVLEHVAPEEGLEYLNIILEGDGALERLFEKFKENDRYGSPRLVEYGAYGKFSPTTLRYIKILQDLRGHFGDLSGKHIVEIGGGYGGQCQIITSFFNVASYTIYDLEPVTRLVRKYLDKNGVRANVKALPFTELEVGIPCDLVISNYAFSECVEEVREMYLRKLVSHAPAGYMICNFEEPRWRAGIARRIPGAKTIAEKPLTASINFTLVWGHRAIAPVSEYKRSVVSQHGEDGILEEIFSRLSSGGKRCVEFGAHDGVHLSNTWRLWALEGWSAMLIEADEDCYGKLMENTRGFSSVEVRHAFVTVEPGALDAMLEPWAKGQKIDLMSIDIDSDDYHVLSALRKYLPRVLVIEYNPTIPEQFLLVPKPGEMVGASARAVHFLAEQKGYTLVAMTPTNLIFVENGEFPKLKMERPLLRELFSPIHLTYLITPYCGAPFVSRVPVYATLADKMYQKPLPRIDEHHPWIPVHITELDVAKSRELATRTPHWVKRELVREYAYLYLIDCLIEAGTCIQDTIEGSTGVFKKIISIESSKPHHLETVKKFSGFGHVDLRLGDNQRLLPEILKKISEPCIFWLDGRYRKESSAKGGFNMPLSKALSAILDHKIRCHVILIDDACCFNGEDDYPVLSDLQNEVWHRRPDLVWTVREDIIRIHPLCPPPLKVHIRRKIAEKIDSFRRRF